MAKLIFHVDVNNAFLSWTSVKLLSESHDMEDPRLIPSVIGGDEELRHGVVLAKSTPAKKYGIVTGESLMEAKRKCPFIQVYSPDRAWYKKQSDAFYSILLRYSDIVERASIDECFIDMSAFYKEAIETADEIREIIKKELQDYKVEYKEMVDAVIELFKKHNINYLEVNGHSQSYFKKNDEHSPVLVQFRSGAAAFESKASNTSIYLDLPASSIDYQQSLGRNARRGQEIEYVTNYIIHPLKANGRTIKYFEKKHNQIVNKTKWNEKFEKTFETPWGQFEEDTL